ncbi:MAG: 1-deoxy-D-xylulose-5-phosphate reductoisomerase, partial [Oscillospiraceae bacterium]
MAVTISVLGSTGSIGRQTLEVAAQLDIPVAALTAHSNIALLEQQVRQFHPHLVAVFDPEAAETLGERLPDTKILSGMEGLLAAATLQEADTVVTAVMGMVGLTPTLAAAERGKRIALANKETLVCAGELVMDTADRYGAKIIPVDSEHSAIFQCLQGCQDPGEIKQLILTCSGGPFYGKTFSQLTGVTSADALRHPNWTMGPKITVDCATLMNKGLEIIEAMRLYRLPLSQIQAVIHRQSIVHSLVEFRDGAILAQLGTADMRLPIRYALTYPNRAESPLPPLNLLTCP